LLAANALLSTTGNSGSCEVSLYASVVSFTQPYRTKRGDWMMSIVLIDDTVAPWSEQSNLRPININIFVPPKNRDKLPLVRYAGDGIRLKDVKVQQWKGDLQLMGTSTSSYVVFRGIVNDPANTTELSYYPTDLENTVLTSKSKEYMLEMWLQTQERFMTGRIMNKEHCFRLSDLRMPNAAPISSSDSTQGDLTVMISAIIPLPEENKSGVTPWGFLRVWDGSGPSISDGPPPPIDRSSEYMTDRDPSTASVIAIADIVQRLAVIRPNLALQPPITLCGRVINVVIWEKQHWDLIKEQIVKIGSFVRFRNVNEHNLADTDLRCLHIHEKSSFTPLPNLNYEVIQLLEDHNGRLRRMEPTNPNSGILPLDIHQLPRSPGRSTCRLQQFILAPIGTSFEGVVRISRLIPTLTPQSTDEEWAEICPLQSDNAVDRVYQFALRLKAAKTTTAVDVHVVDSVTVGTPIGERLFGRTATQAVTAKCDALTYFDQAVFGQSWRVCVRSFLSCERKQFLLLSMNEA
jgi:Telomeric single stranded DNA binding POT1/CDC13